MVIFHSYVKLPEGSLIFLIIPPFNELSPAWLHGDSHGTIHTSAASRTEDILGLHQALA